MIILSNDALRICHKLLYTKQTILQTGCNELVLERDEARGMSTDRHKSNLYPYAIENFCRSSHFRSSVFYVCTYSFTIPSGRQCVFLFFFSNKRQAISNHPATSSIRNGKTKINQRPLGSTNNILKKSLSDLVRQQNHHTDGLCSINMRGFNNKHYATDNGHL